MTYLGEHLSDPSIVHVSREIRHEQRTSPQHCHVYLLPIQLSLIAGKSARDRICKSEFNQRSGRQKCRFANMPALSYLSQRCNTYTKE